MAGQPEVLSGTLEFGVGLGAWCKPLPCPALFHRAARKTLAGRAWVAALKWGEGVRGPLEGPLGR